MISLRHAEERANEVGFSANHLLLLRAGDFQSALTYQAVATPPA